MFLLFLAPIRRPPTLKKHGKFLEKFDIILTHCGAVVTAC